MMSKETSTALELSNKKNKYPAMIPGGGEGGYSYERAGGDDRKLSKKPSKRS